MRHYDAETVVFLYKDERDDLGLVESGTPVVPAGPRHFI
jgi:hypothetical protein